jgi:pimeloyl-ACP methyl ester carboxylesterase
VTIGGEHSTGSSQHVYPINYDTFEEDLHKLITQLKLSNCTLVGFSMGGGEEARYLGSHQRLVIQILEIGGNLLFSIFEYRRNLQPAAEFFVSFIDQKTLCFGYRCFE